MASLSEILPQLKNKNIYLYLTKENPDWTSNSGVSLVFHVDGKKISLSLDEENDLYYLASSLHHFISTESIVLSWNAKDIFSFIKRKTEINLELNNNIIDLYVISSYFGLDSKRPETFKEAVEIVKKSMSLDGWKQFNSFYSKVYIPLFSKVLPDIESNCLVDNLKRKCVYPTYVLEGQANGRLKTAKINSLSYNPHSIGRTEKSNLRSKDYDQVFVYFDYKNMEVNVLHWLSGDEELGKILASKKDLYKEIWRRITKQDPTDAHRVLCKNIFLPVVFGQGKTSLSKKLSIPEEIAAKLINSFCKTFPVAFDWVTTQTVDCNNMATDFFGRRRTFDEKKLYKVRNFCIQSPASMICLRKLVLLHESLSDHASVCFHVHDGYCVLCDKNKLHLVSELGKKILESEDGMFSGLKLRTTCHYGNNLNDLKNFNQEVIT